MANKNVNSFLTTSNIDLTTDSLLSIKSNELKQFKSSTADLSVNTINATNIVYTSGNQIISGNKTFLNSGVFSLSGIIPLALPNNPLSVVGSGNSYIQLNIQNRATGTNATADLVITANNGTDTSNYINLGINNSGYNDPAFTNGTGLDGYLFINGGNLDIGTQTPGRNIEFHAGGTTLDKVAVIMSSSGVLVTGSIFNDEFEYINKIPSLTDLNTPTQPYLWFSNGTNSATSLSCTSQFLFLSPFWVSANCTIISGGCLAGTNAAPIDVDIGLYGANINGLPDSRLVYGNLTAATTVAGDILRGTTSSVSLRRGMYWGAVMPFGANANLYQTAVSSMTTNTNTRATVGGLDRLLPFYKDVTDAYLITTVTAGSRLPTALAGTNRKLDFVTAGQASTAYRSRTTAPSVFFIPRM
jgi:hypothetical protein